MFAYIYTKSFWTEEKQFLAELPPLRVYIFFWKQVPK